MILRRIDAINDLRKTHGNGPVLQHVINNGHLLADEFRAEFEEAKISSSSLRARKLGTLLRPVRRSPNARSARARYLIGLAGGSASGKTTIGKKLTELGATVIDCDKLGHEAYVPGTSCHRSVGESFGMDVGSASWKGTRYVWK